MNRIIEMATPRIFDLNQKLLNYAINNLIVPRINRILTMFSVLTPSTKAGLNVEPLSDNVTVYLRELDDRTIKDFLRKHPIPINDNIKIIDTLFNEKFLSTRVNNKVWK